MKIDIFSFNGSKKEVKRLDTVGSEFFLKTDTGNGMKDYRLSVDREGNLVLTLINGQDVKITSSNGYPAVKLIGSPVIKSFKNKDKEG